MYEALTVLLEQKTICTIILVIAYLFTDDAIFQSTVHNLIISTISTEKKTIDPDKLTLWNRRLICVLH